MAPPTNWKGWPYLVAFVPGGMAGAFVPLSVLLVLSLQPANAPKRPNSAIRANNLCILRVSFTKSVKRTSKIFGGHGIRLANHSF